VDEIVISTEYMIIDTGSEIVISVPWIRSTAQDGEPFEFLPDRTGARTISRQHGEVNVTALRHSPSDLVNVGLDSSKVRKEACGH